MSRPLRIEYNNALYHITARGNERKNIFFDKKDYDKFLFYLGVVQKRYNIIIYGYVLMGNHYHLLIETPDSNLSRMMRDLNGHYTIYFNKRHKRAGHLFQGRYKSILVDKDSYLLELSRYIHLNPVRAKITSRPEDFIYSSMRYYINSGNNLRWLNLGFILGQFGDTKNRQIKAYKDFVYEGMGKTGSPLKDCYANVILGKDKFIKEVMQKYIKKGKISKEIPKVKKLRYGKELEDIGRLVMKFYKTDKDELAKKKSRLSKGKKVLVYLAREYTDNSLMGIRRYLNNSVTEAGISKLYVRTKVELGKDRKFRKEVNKIETELLRGN